MRITVSKDHAIESRSTQFGSVSGARVNPNRVAFLQFRGKAMDDGFRRAGRFVGSGQLIEYGQDGSGFEPSTTINSWRVTAHT